MPSAPARIVKTTNEVKVLAFEGKLDTQTAPDAQQQLTRLIEAGENRFLVNFEKLDYISSAGLRVLESHEVRHHIR